MFLDAWVIILSVYKYVILFIVRTRFEYLNPKDGWTQAQKTQNNEFVESGLENWALTSWTTNIIDSGDRKRKINWFKLKKIVIGTVRGDKFLYIFLSSVITKSVLDGYSVSLLISRSLLHEGSLPLYSSF